ncbi:MAG TPA: hypothetical protein VGR67_03460 [Candidatus Polarisedimenticolia bacterium]|jgi:hypothetical protein|nr:hypothetical protein [Candidatus Polarisedimenticolia bacterium]
MHHRRVWMIRLSILTLVAAAGLAIMVQQGLAGESAGKASSSATMARAETSGPAGEFTTGAATDAPTPQEPAQASTSTAACKRAPQCSVDSDCDVVCGPGLGKCVHSSCPTRICKCH